MDANGTMVMRTQGIGVGQTWTVYVGRIYEITNTGAVTKYYHALGRAIAVRQGGTVSYLLADHLGSTVETLDTSGATLNEMRYWPYGGTRAGGVPQTDKLYTGQQQEPDTAQPDIPANSIGLYNYKARFYSTVTGRFVSVDPIYGGDASSWSAYAYVKGNPVLYNDPTGMCIPDITCPKGVDAAASRRQSAQVPSGCGLECLNMRAAARAYEHAAFIGALQYCATNPVRCGAPGPAPAPARAAAPVPVPQQCYPWEDPLCGTTNKGTTNPECSIQGKNCDPKRDYGGADDWGAIGKAAEIIEDVVSGDYLTVECLQLVIDGAGIAGSIAIPIGAPLLATAINSSIDAYTGDHAGVVTTLGAEYGGWFPGIGRTVVVVSVVAQGSACYRSAN